VTADAEAKLHEAAFFDGKSTLVEQAYCRPFNKLDAAERRLVLFQYMKRATLEYFEGTPMTGLNALLGDDGDTNKPSEESKTLVISSLDVIAFKRFFVSSQNGYRFPVTIQFVGCNGEAFGISVKIYDPQSPQDETNSQFLAVFNSFETGNKVRAAGKKKNLNFNLDDYRNKFGLVELLELKGFEIILDKLIEKPKPTVVPKMNTLPVPKGLPSQMLPLEQIFSSAR